jgi:hypothetical protein
MAKSVKQLQDEVLSYLDSQGQSKAAFEDVEKLEGIEKLLVLSAANFIIKVQENLNQSGRVDTGALASDIEEGEVQAGAGSVSITVGYPAGSKAAKYYDFVNKGVKGTRSGSPSDSPYSFKNERVGGPMQFAIAKWLRRNASAGRMEDQKKNLSAVQRKRKRLSKMVDQNKRLRSLAYAVSVSIKRNGLKKTGFIDKAAQFAFGKEFNDAVAKIIGREVVINIRNGNNSK